MKKITTIAAAIAGVLALSACATGEQALDPGDGGAAGSSGDAIVIGSADFTESQLIATIYSVALSDAGIEVQEQFNIGSREVYMTALQDGSIDLIPEYAGATVKHLDPESEASDLESVLGELDALLPAGITHLEPSQAENKNSLTVTQATADEHALTTISDLAPVASTLKLGGPPEWETRVSGVVGLRDVYGLEFAEFVTLDAGGPLTLTALENGQIDVGNVFTTDPAIEANGLVVLDDDKGLFPAENVLPVVVESKVDETVSTTLDAISGALTTDDLLEMNTRHGAGDDMRMIATEWLQENGLL